MKSFGLQRSAEHNECKKGGLTPSETSLALKNPPGPDTEHFLTSQSTTCTWEHTHLTPSSVFWFLPACSPTPSVPWPWPDCSPSSCSPSVFTWYASPCKNFSSSCVRSTLPRVSVSSPEAAGSSEEGVTLVKESENESGSALGCVGLSGRPSGWLSPSSVVQLLDTSKLEGTAESVLPSSFGSAVLFSGAWAKKWWN